MKASLDERYRQLLAAHGPALAIWRALPNFRGESSEKTFIFRIAQNRAVTYLAQQRSGMVSAEEIELPDPRISV